MEAFKQSGCSVFVDLFCGSLAMLCYLSWDTMVVVNDINGNLTNLYMVIRDSPSVFVKLMKLPYSEVLFQQFKDDLEYSLPLTNGTKGIIDYTFCELKNAGRWTIMISPSKKKA